MKLGSKLIVGFFALAVLVTLGIVGIRWSNQASKPPVRGERIVALAPCPDKPNCVCTTAEDEQHAIKPIVLGPQKAAMDKIGGDGEPGASIVSEESHEEFVERTLERVTQVIRRTGGSVVERRDNYLRAEYRSNLLAFVDDVEFLVDAQRTLHFRSASRVGHSDLGVNRERMERFRKMFLAPLP